MIRYLGLGWEEAHRPWSVGSRLLGSKELLDHLIKTVIPLSKKMKVPSKAPTNTPKLPDVQAVSTVSDLAKELKRASDAAEGKFKEEAKAEMVVQQESGDADLWLELQATLPLKAGKLKNFLIEMQFKYTDEQGNGCLGWYNTAVKEVLDAANLIVKIEWNVGCMSEFNAGTTVQKLVPKNWNTKRSKKGSRQKYITK